MYLAGDSRSTFLCRLASELVHPTRVISENVRRSYERSCYECRDDR